MEQVKISVVVPTYNRPLLLTKCLQHLVNQTLGNKHYEIIVVSDGPDEASREVVERHHANQNCMIRFLSLKTKGGPAAARNLGWQHASAPLIAFTDDDCLPDQEWLNVIVSHYNQEPEIAFTGKMIVPVSADPSDYELNTKGLETGDFVTANCVVTKKALQATGGIDEKFTAAWREDSDLEFKLLERGVPVVKLEKAIVVHPVRKVRWGISLHEQKKTMFNALLYKKYPRLYRQRIKAAPTWRYYFIVLFFGLFVSSLMIQLQWLAVCSCALWLFLTGRFIVMRLSRTSKKASHVAEMIVTSIAIPFLSVYWTLYGAVKYRVLLF